ncbi:POK18 protein, partial [Psophia crepitans]|nr:POK18 protein [Psophia crepitans]
PWKYLGWLLFGRTLKPQQLCLANCVSTLNDLQQLLGAVNWIRPILGISSRELGTL